MIVNQALCIDFVDLTKVPKLMILYLLFNRFYQQLVLLTTTLLFVPILKQFTVIEYTIKDCFSFCKEILHQDSNFLIVSFYIQSLFTNIPLDQTIKICVDLVFHKKKKVKGILKQYFKLLVTLLLYCEHKWLEKGPLEFGR